MPISQIERIGKHLGYSVVPHRKGKKLEGDVKAFERIPTKLHKQEEGVSIRGGGVSTRGPLVRIIESSRGKTYLVESSPLSYKKIVKHKVLFTELSVGEERPHAIVDVEGGKSFMLMKPPKYP